MLNKNVDIKCIAHDAFLELISSGDAQYRNIGNPYNLKVLVSNKTKLSKHDSQRSPMP
jgi:hypothetical protein